LQKAEAWLEYAEKPDLSLPPGVRVKVGERHNTYDGATRDPAKHVSPTESSSIGKWGLNETPHGLPETAPSTDLAKQWAGYKSHQLKPAFEFIIVARKPMSEKPIRENVKKWGVGGYNIDAGRIPKEEGDRTEYGVTGITRKTGNVYGEQSGQIEFDGSRARFPANLISSGGAMGADNRYFDLDRWSQENGFDEDWVAQAKAGLLRVPKPSKKEKEAGCGEFESQSRPVQIQQSAGRQLAGKAETMPTSNPHPTVKPVALFGWLLALGCPKGGIMLDPFVGSGSSCVAAIKGGWQYIGIDQDEHYCEIAEARAAYAKSERMLAKDKQDE